MAKTIYTLVAMTSSNIPELIKSYTKFSYENAIEMKNTIIDNECPSDSEEDLEYTDNCFQVNFWDNVDEWDNTSEDNTLVWSDGCVDYYIYTSTLKTE